jgi:hypothetical protein
VRDWGTVREFVEGGKSIQEVFFCCFSSHDFAAAEQALRKMIAARQ